MDGAALFHQAPPDAIGTSAGSARDPIASGVGPPEGQEGSVTMSSAPYRVVQWATGNIGLRSLRAVIEHPDLNLVGLYVYSESKAGKDAGELCGLAPTGVLATRDIDEMIALRPDCVLYMGDRVDVDAICRLLESGANVVSTRSEFHRPASLDPATRARLDGRVCSWQFDPLQHGVEPGLHHRSPAVRLALDAAPPRPSRDRGVRRHVVAQLARDDLRPHGFRA